LPGDSSADAQTDDQVPSANTHSTSGHGSAHGDENNPLDANETSAPNGEHMGSSDGTEHLEATTASTAAKPEKDESEAK